MNCYIQLRGGNKLLIIIDGVRSQVLQKSRKSKIYHFLQQFSKRVSEIHIQCRLSIIAEVRNSVILPENVSRIIIKALVVPFGSIPNLKSKWSKSMPLFRQRRLKTIFFGTVRSYIAYMRVPPSLPYPLPSTTTPSPSTLPPLMNCAFKQIQRQNTISMNSCIQYKTKNRKEKKRDK